jgi:Cys-tRNA(Pro) deacylase
MAAEGEPGPATPALEAVAAAGIPHDVVRTRRARSVEEAAELRGVSVHALLKTLVVRRTGDRYVFVLVPGDRVIDWPKLRTHLGVRRLSLPDADEARRVTGYERGAITPFGATRAWPVVADASLPERGPVSIGGGAHGVSITLDAGDLVAVLDAAIVDVTSPV